MWKIAQSNSKNLNVQISHNDAGSSYDPCQISVWFYCCYSCARYQGATKTSLLGCKEPAPQLVPSVSRASTANLDLAGPRTVGNESRLARMSGKHLELGSDKGDPSPFTWLAHNCDDLFLLSKPRGMPPHCPPGFHTTFFFLSILLFFWFECSFIV